MADIKWIKISTDIFDNKKIKQIEGMQKGDTIVVIWVKLLTLAGKINDGGNIYIVPGVPYDDKALAIELGKPLKVVREAIGIFEQFDMIGIDNGYIVITGWEKYQNTEAMDKIRRQTRDRVRRHRSNANATHNVTQDVTHSNADVTHIDIDIDKDKEIDIERVCNNKHSLKITSPDDILDFIPKARLILDNIDFNFPIEEIEPFYYRNSQYKWKGISDEDSLAHAMAMWMIRKQDYEMDKKHGG